MSRPPLPPFTLETAVQKVRLAEDAWNGRDPARVALAYTPDSRWRNRSTFLQGRAAIEGFLAQKWQRELDYRLIKELWAFDPKAYVDGQPPKPYRVGAVVAEGWVLQSAQGRRISLGATMGGPQTLVLDLPAKK